MNPLEQHHERSPYQDEGDRKVPFEDTIKSDSSSSDAARIKITAVDDPWSSSQQNVSMGAEKIGYPLAMPAYEEEKVHKTQSDEVDAESSLGAAFAPKENESPRKKDFPWKLHCMIDDAEKFNNQHIVAWQPDGLAFRVLRPEDLVTKIMPHYFHQTQYRSFQRMLNLYEFQKVLSGPNRGCYSHPKFIRSDRNKCLLMRIRKRTRTTASIGFAGVSATSPKRRGELVVDSDLISSFGEAPANESLRQFQLQELLPEESGIQITHAIHQGRDQLSRDSAGQNGLQLFQQQEHHGVVPMSSASFEVNTTSIMQHQLEPTIADFGFGSHSLSTFSTDMAHGGTHHPYHHQQLISYQQREVESPDLAIETDQGIPPNIGNGVGTTSNSLNFLHAAWDTPVTGAPLHGDGDTKDEQISPVRLSCTDGGRFCSPTVVATGHSALLGTVPWDEPLHQSLQQQQEGQQTDAGSLSFQWPLSSDLEPTPLPP